MFIICRFFFCLSLSSRTLVKLINTKLNCGFHQFSGSPFLLFPKADHSSLLFSSSFRFNLLLFPFLMQSTSHLFSFIPQSPMPRDQLCVSVNGRPLQEEAFLVRVERCSTRWVKGQDSSCQLKSESI